MKNLLLLILLFITFSCKSQTVSLETAAQCRVNNANCSSFTYIKDINNSLDKYIGNWKGNFNGVLYEFNFIKKLNIGEDIKKDKLIGRIKIINTNGIIIYNTFNETDDAKTKLRGDNFQSNLKSYMMNFSGPSTKGCINRGTIYLTMKPNNQLNIIYLPDYDIVIGECPSSFSSTIPEKQTITLVKQ